MFRAASTVLIVFVLWRSAALGVPPGFREDRVSSGWDEAIGLTFAENGRMFVWERTGLVWIVEDGVRLPVPFIDLRAEVGDWGDHGLFSVALDPAYLSNGHVYLLYGVERHHLLHFGTPSYDPSVTTEEGPSIGRLARYTARAEDGFRTADLSTRLVLMGETIDTGVPLAHPAHGVGTLVFAQDNTLLLSTGDSASFVGVDTGAGAEGNYAAPALADGILRADQDVGAFRAQHLGSLNGKILRVDPATGDGVLSNPFYSAAAPRSERSRIYALGFRNPFRMAIRDGTGSDVEADGDPGALYVGDVAWNTWEELHVITTPGENCGWPIFEGMELNPDGAYVSASVRNQEALNPLGCRTFFHFEDLITQETLDPSPFFPNPCNPAQAIPGSVDTFVHSRPALDWNHDSAVTRVGTFDGFDAVSVRLSALDSPVSGSEFAGKSSTGGVWYTGQAYPEAYQGVYYLADYNAQWIRRIRFDSEDQPVAVEDFSGGHAYVALAMNPVDEFLYFVEWPNGVWRISYEDHVAPTIVSAWRSASNDGRVVVTFSERMGTPEVANAIRYTIDGGISVLSANVLESTTVELITSPIAAEALVRLTVSGVSDFAGNPIGPDSTNEITFLPLFRRGDSNGDARLTIDDPLTSLFHQFLGSPVACREALDFDDDGVLAIQDPIANLTHQFFDGHPPAPPGAVCGEDLDGDDLGCETGC